jgi:hypothetical protein
MKSLISFSIISLFLFTGITNTDTAAPKIIKKTVLKEKKVEQLFFYEPIIKPSDSLVQQVSRLEKGVKHAESEIVVIKKQCLLNDSLKLNTFVVKDTLLKKDSVILKKKRFIDRVIDKLK